MGTGLCSVDCPERLVERPVIFPGPLGNGISGSICALSHPDGCPSAADTGTRAWGNDQDDRAICGFPEGVRTHRGGARPEMDILLQRRGRLPVPAARKSCRWPLETRAYQGDDEVIAYAEFAKTFNGQKYRFDRDRRPFWRRDQDLFADRYFGDSSRRPGGFFPHPDGRLQSKGRTKHGDSNPEAGSEGASIPFLEAKYSGQKDVAVICSPDLGVVRSL